MAKSIKIPAWFSPYSKPTWWDNPPQEYINSREVIHSFTLNEYEILPELQPDLQYIVYDIDGASDGWGSKEVTIHGVAKEGIPNPNYKKQLADYNKRKAQHEKQLAEWDALKVEWDAKQARDAEIAERRQYLKLKEKYEKKKTK